MIKIITDHLREVTPTQTAMNCLSGAALFIILLGATIALFTI
ncbi:hypothetical protein [uncultured Pelagimonas sp.]|nr:hypothetical protein [uncultured Pelagimonas sp.]